MAEMQNLRDIGERILERQKLHLVKQPSPVRSFGSQTAASATIQTKAECPRCFGAGYVITSRFEPIGTEVEIGPVNMREVSGAVECGCKRRRRLRAFRASIPPEFRRANLARLRPRLDCHELQAGAIDFVKTDPLASYAFCGRNRAGKSYIAWCLARNAYISGSRVVACNLSGLLDEYRAT